MLPSIAADLRNIRSGFAIVPSPKWLETRRDEFPKDFIDEVLVFSKEAIDLLKNLLAINSLKKLDKELSLKFWHFIVLKNDVCYLFLREFSHRTRDEESFKKEFLRFLKQAYGDLEGTIRDKAEFLSSSQQKRLLHAVEGLACFSINFIEEFFTTNKLPVEQSILSKILESFLKAEMCVTTIFFFLNGDINGRDQRALYLLVKAADMYVLQVEDILLAEDPELKKRLAQETESISLVQLEQRLGLSNRDR